MPKQTPQIAVYTRDIDAGAGYQQVLVVDDVIVAQTLISKTGGRYTVEGNPELVGQPRTALRGWGFTYHHYSQARLDELYIQYLQEEIEKESSE